jgi:excinuclease UvrABC nuclease subunit
MSLTHADKCLLPHAVYWMYNRQMELLYVGCSYTLCSRLVGHSTTQIWITEVAALKVKWFDNELLGRRAEAQAILSDKPRYNSRTTPPDAVGYWKQRHENRTPRGDGLTCPKCGDLKRRRADAYCLPCYNTYQKLQRVKRAAARAAG